VIVAAGLVAAGRGGGGQAGWWRPGAVVAAGYGSLASARGTIATKPAITKPNSAITPMM
jgi:hypothetical protein